MKSFSVLGNNFTTNDRGVTCNDYCELGVHIWQDWKRTGLLSDMYYYRGINMTGSDLHTAFPEIYNCACYKIGENINFKSYDHTYGFTGFMGGGYTPEKLNVHFEVIDGSLFKKLIKYDYVLIADALNTKTIFGELYKDGKLITRSRPVKCYYKDIESITVR